jgi:hypothetical protein
MDEKMSEEGTINNADALPWQWHECTQRRIEDAFNACYTASHSRCSSTAAATPAPIDISEEKESEKAAVRSQEEQFGSLQRTIAQSAMPFLPPVCRGK